MSRAFVNESDAQFEGQDVPAIKIPLPPGARNYMTPQGAERLRSELQQLSQAERPRLSAELARSVSGAEQADREALSRLRLRLREVERRIEYLGAMLSRLEVVDPRDQDPQRVAFGATVSVREEGAAEAPPESYRIVGVDESDPAQGRVSWISPLARALTSARVGEVVTLELPDGRRRLRVLSVEYA